MGRFQDAAETIELGSKFGQGQPPYAQTPLGSTRLVQRVPIVDVMIHHDQASWFPRVEGFRRRIQPDRRNVLARILAHARMRHRNIYRMYGPWPSLRRLRVRLSGATWACGVEAADEPAPDHHPKHRHLLAGGR